MSSRREIRELALQALYQYDARGEADLSQIERSVLDAPGPEAVKRQALEVARGAWSTHADADALTSEFSPEWPTHRQPPVDRSILRLGYYEIAHGLAPAAVIINEAVELAKAYGSERSPAFINGVLDKIAKRLHETGGGAVAGAGGEPEAQRPEGKPPEDPWLRDAMNDSRPLS